MRRRRSRRSIDASIASATARLRHRLARGANAGRAFGDDASHRGHRETIVQCCVRKRFVLFSRARDRAMRANEDWFTLSRCSYRVANASRRAPG
ncbi:hypothetical protein [Lysobacter gummosus]|uniref:hypothetical protein n=1 Tax=Lysobacter gummosus TaxID=262324 RepID=UPI003624BEB9